MARLLLTVGDFQAWVQPVPGSVNRDAATFIDEGHPLAAGDHEIGFYEVGPGGGPYVSAICGEADALTALGAWLLMDTTDAAYANAQRILSAIFNPTNDPAKNLDWLFP